MGRNMVTVNLSVSFRTTKVNGSTIRSMERVNFKQHHIRLKDNLLTISLTVKRL
jgi:hypothetical protein